MIRFDIEINKDNLNKFLPNRSNVDQPGYRVGKINEEVIVINSNNIPMDNFYDDRLDLDWFDLELINPLYKGYKINRDGEVIGIKNKSKLTKLVDTWGYPIFKIKGKHPKIHRLLGSLFKPNYYPDTNIEIDHIDRDKNNYSLSNLRWVSRTENANNMFRPKWTGNNLYLAYTDKNLKNEVLRLNNEQLFSRYFSHIKNYKSRISKSNRLNCKFDNYYWKIVDLNLIDYLRGRNIDETMWREHYLKKFYVHPLGLIKNLQGIITPGAKTTEAHPEMKYHFKGNKCLRVHVLVAEVFLNNNKPLDKGLVVDHIDTDPSNNCLGNLKITTQKGNMNNLLTVRKLSKKVVNPQGQVFNSISECAKFYNVKVSAIWARLNGRRPSHGFHYLEDNKLNNNQ